MSRLMLVSPHPAVCAGLGLLLALAAPGQPAAASVLGFQVRPHEEQALARSLDALERSADLPRVWVYFTDKEVRSSEGLAARLAIAERDLSPKLRERRSGPGPLFPLDFHDLPVADRYVRGLEAAGAEVHRVSRWLNAASVRADLPALRRIAALPFVHRLAPVRATGSDRGWISPTAPSRSGAPDRARPDGDPFDYGNSRDQIEQIRVDRVHQLGYSGAGILIGMLDTGYLHDHPAFAEIKSSGRLLAQYDFIQDDEETSNEEGDSETQHFHGTYTWSALAGFAPGELIGPAYGASFLLAKTEDVGSETPVEEDNWIAAVEWADSWGADILSSSLNYIDWYTYEDMDGDTAPISIAADIATSRGILVVSSAGNQGSSEWRHIGAPADGDSVLAVGAVDRNNEVAGFSSRGPTSDGQIKPEVVALGIDTYCAVPPSLGTDYFWISGTSLSCPLVAGSAALLLEAHPEWGPLEARSALLLTADNHGTPDNDRGWGLIDVDSALAAPVVVPDGPTPGLSAPTVLVQPNPSAGRFALSWAARRGPGDPLHLTVLDAAGREVYRGSATAGANEIAWDGRNREGRRLGSGVYFATLRSGEWRATARLVLAR